MSDMTPEQANDMLEQAQSELENGSFDMDNGFDDTPNSDEPSSNHDNQNQDEQKPKLIWIMSQCLPIWAVLTSYLKKPTRRVILGF